MGWMKVFEKELTDALESFLKYWTIFQEERFKEENEEVESEDILNEIFKVSSEREFLSAALANYPRSRQLKKDRVPGVFINDIRNRMGEQRRRVLQRPAPVAGVIPAFAQITDQVEIHRPPRAEHHRQPSFNGSPKARDCFRLDAFLLLHHAP